MASFLFWIGAYNVAGALFVLSFLSEPFADKVLRRWLEILAEPYQHGAHGPLWIWWASSTNLAMGAIMILATRWELAAQRGVTAVVVAVYAAMTAVSLLAARSPRYKARGIYGTLVLWVAQIAWGAATFVDSYRA